MSWMLVWFSPIRRRSALVLASVYVGVAHPLREMARSGDLPVPKDWFGLTLLVLAIFAILWLFYLAAANFKSLPAMMRRHPQWFLHLMYWGFLVVLWATLPTAGLWRAILLGIAIIFPFLIWRLGYMLMSGHRAAGTSFVHQLICLWPAYGGSDTPHGKGLDYLSKFEAKNEEELAQSQLAGIKLILLAYCWQFGMYLMQEIVYGPEKMVPRLGRLVELGSGAPFFASWSSIYCELVWQVLHRAADGHVIIGALRLFGFNVFRNTYKPLLSESLAEFWGRYYYYFKELLLNFFFMPVFMQLGGPLGRRPHLRLFAAVFAATFLGNLYYHFIKHGVALAQGHVFSSVYSLRSEAFYCLLLTIGIYISMLRTQRRGGEMLSAAPVARLTRIFGVWTFFSLIFIWDVSSHAPFLARVNFFLGLFGLA